jgi:hypothetical protein
MRYSLVALAAAFLSTTSAYVLPSNQADGFYRVVRSADGQEVHEALDTAPTRRYTSPSAQHLSKRDFGQTHCGCGIKLNTGDTDAAVADLKNQLSDKGHWISPSLSYYSIHGSVIAFVCNEDANSVLKAWTDIVTQAAGQITRACGQYVAGSTGANYDFSIGYMQNGNGVDFCGNALSAPAKSCSA